MLLSVFGIERQNTDPIDNDEHDDNNNNNNTGVRGSWSWLCWGIHSFSEYRTILLIAAFCFNLCAVACITVAAMAIQTSPKLKHIGWAASDPVRLSQSNLILECPSNLQDKGIDITVQVWLGLTGYYGECRGQMFRKHNKEQPQGTTSSSSTTTHTRGSIHYHSDSFCSASTISNNQTIIDRDILGLCENPAATEDNNNDNNNDNDDDNDNDNDNDDGDTIHNNIINCELLTGENEHSSIANNNGGDEYYCSACKDNSRNCVGTLLSSAAFGAFPLVLTIRRLCSSKRERGLRLRTLFFSSLAEPYFLVAWLSSWGCIPF